MSSRPAIASGPALAVGEVRSILDEAAAPDARPWILVLKEGDAPWSDAWTGLALCVGERSLIVPRVGAWPVDDLGDPDAITAEDLVAALRVMTLAPRNPIDPGITPDGADALRRIASRRVLEAVAEGDPVPARLAAGSGRVTCEIGMDEDGSPIVWMISSVPHETHQLERGAVDPRVDLAEPLLLSVRPMSLVVDHLPDGDCVVLAPRCNDEGGVTVEIDLPGPVEVMRHVAETAAALPVVHAHMDEMLSARAFVDAAHAAVGSMSGDPRRCLVRFENRCEGSVSMSLAVILPHAVGGIDLLVVSMAPEWSFSDMPHGIVEDRDALGCLAEIRRALSTARRVETLEQEEARLRDEARDWIAAATVHMPDRMRDAPAEGWSIIVEREASTGDRFVPIIDQTGTMDDDYRLDHAIPAAMRAAVIARNPTRLRLTIVDGTAILAPTDVSGDILVIEHDPMNMMRRIAALREHRP